MAQYATPKKVATKDLFLDEFAIHGNVTRACKAAGIDRRTLYRWKEQSDSFLMRYNLAFEEAKDNIRDEIYRRGHDGVEEPVYQQGIRVDTIRKYSDTLLIFHAKMLMPEYRDKSQLDVTANVTTNAGTISIDTRAMNADQLARLKQLALELKAGEK